MLTSLILLLVLMILGALVALESKDLLSGIISLGIIGFALTIIFLILHAPDLAIVQIVVETMTLVILIAAVLKTTREDTTEKVDTKKVLLWVSGLVFVVVFMMTAIKAFQHLPDFGFPTLRMAQAYIDEGLFLTGATNLVAAIILDFRGYDTLGEATVLFTSVVGVVTVLRRVGRKQA
ncbi:MAG: hydrogen gas-evolving membrane-bound hydrogenase subunit E [bacterium]